MSVSSDKIKVDAPSPKEIPSLFLSYGLQTLWLRDLKLSNPDTTKSVSKSPPTITIVLYFPSFISLWA